ncbi:MAG: YqaA family protein [Mariprofundaceae bacterium]
MKQPEVTDSNVSEEAGKRKSLLRRCYHWTLSWADHPHAKLALFLIALIESSIFPIPPDILLIALALGRPDHSFRFAAVSTVGSTIGAAIGYLIGMALFATIAIPIINFYGVMEQFELAQGWFETYGVAIILIAGFSPIPFKVFTIAAGAFGLPFLWFMLASLVSRGTRFYLEAALLHWGGARLRALVERHFEWITMAVTVLVIGGFALLWLLR